MNENRNFSTVEIAKFMDVSYKTVGRWIDDGKLEAFVTPGGHRRVYADKLIDFIRKRNMKTPPELEILESSNILIVDDDKKILGYIKKAIRKKFPEYEVYTASNGFAAGESVAEHSPILVILDIMLPGIDGFEVCKNIKERNKDIKVIAITGYDSPERKKKMLECGADGYLTKPFGYDDLIDSVNVYLAQVKK